MSVIAKVSIHEKDFLKGYLEKQLDPIYHILCNIHDLCLGNDLYIPNREETRIKCKEFLDMLIHERSEKSRKLNELPKLGSLVKILAKSEFSKKLIIKYGDVGRLQKITHNSTMIVNKECKDTLGSIFQWGYRLTLDEADYEVIKE